MLIQKTFHLQMPREMAKAKLGEVADYSRHLNRVKVEPSADGIGVHVEFRLACGFGGSVDLEELPGDSSSQLFFRSVGGNMKVVGVVEFFQINPSLTEVVLTLDYFILSLFYKLLDFLSRGVDRFLNRQLVQVEAYFAPRRNQVSPLNGHASHGKAA